MESAESGSQTKKDLTAKISHPKMGVVRYSTVYFSVDEPIMFSCFFSNTPHKYVGIQVEHFELKGVVYRSYLFVGALDNEIRAMESKPGFLRKYLSSSPVLWCNISGDDVTWKEFKGAPPFYLPIEEATLKCY